MEEEVPDCLEVAKWYPAMEGGGGRENI